MQRLTRRQMMASSAGGLLAAGLWPGWLGAKDTETKPFRFIVVNDLHVIDEKCQPWFDRVVTSMTSQTSAVEFVAVVGDLCEDGTAVQLDQAKAILKSFKVPVHTVPGNHDYLSMTDRSVYDRLFPKQLNYRFDHAGWQFVALDTTEGTKWEKVTAGKPTLDWLAAEIPKLDKSKPTTLLTHFPLGEGVKMRLANADAVLDHFKPLNLRGVFNGHYHAFTEKKVGTTIVTTNRCCSHARNNHDGTKPKGYFLCETKDGSVAREFVEVKPG